MQNQTIRLIKVWLLTIIMLVSAEVHALKIYKNDGTTYTGYDFLIVRNSGSNNSCDGWNVKDSAGTVSTFNQIGSNPECPILTASSGAIYYSTSNCSAGGSDYLPYSNGSPLTYCFTGAINQCFESGGSYGCYIHLSERDVATGACTDYGGTPTCHNTVASSPVADPLCGKGPCKIKPN